MYKRQVRLTAPGVTGPLLEGDARLVHPSWPVALGTAVELRWRRDGVGVALSQANRPWSVRAGADGRGETTIVQPGIPVVIGSRGTVEVWRGDVRVARVGVRPESSARLAAPPSAPPEAPLSLRERRLLVRVILDVAASTLPVGDAVSSLLARDATADGVTLAARLGPRPVETLGRWLADEQNEAFRLALADALAATSDPASLRARLPKAIRCWIPRLQSVQRAHPLRVLAGCWRSGGSDG